MLNSFFVASVALYSLLALALGAPLEPPLGPWFFILSVAGIVTAVGLFVKKGWGELWASIFGLWLMYYVGSGKSAVGKIGMNPDDGRSNYPSESSEQNKELPTLEAEKSIEKLKYELELEQFRWQKATYRKGHNFLNQNFGVVITTIVSLAAVLVSYLQLSISSNNTKTQIENDQLRNERQFYFEVAKFLLDHEQELTTRDSAHVLYLRNVVITSFPKSVAVQIASSMRDTAATADVRKLWEDGLVFLRSKGEDGLVSLRSKR